MPIDQTVEFVTGRRFRRDWAAQERQRHYQHAQEKSSSYAETTALRDYLNTPAGVANQRQLLMRQAVTKYGAEAVAVALQLESPASRIRSLGILLAMRVQPLQYFTASRHNKTRRIFPANAGLGMLPRAVSEVLIQDWCDFDLRYAQLAICARLWQVPEVLAFLEQGGQIWDALLTYLGWPLDAGHKKPVKTALYTITFGAHLPNLAGMLAREHPTHPALRAMGVDSFVTTLLQHPLIAALCRRRQVMLDDALTRGFIHDCYGAYIPVPEEADAMGRQRPNPRSVLAQEAQAMEFAIVEAVVKLAQTTNEFAIVHWAHDGFTVSIRDARRRERWIQRIIECVNAQAEEYGVPTELELKLAPQAEGAGRRAA
ncbi:MAG: hypothetical protein HGA45_17325 [Chloroflexales bacterium]|nr:hypothetical protein [Chloroflexales bacterium]